MKWKEERSRKIAEYILFFYLCALTVMAISLLSAFKLTYFPNRMYLNYPVSGLILGVFALTGIIYLTKDYVTVITSSEITRPISLLVSFLICLFAIAIVFILDFHGSSFKVLYFIPVIYASINHGQKYGLIFTLLCVIPLLIPHLLNYSPELVNKALEADLILSLIIFMAAWLIGGFLDIERETIKKLAEMANRDDLTGLWNKRYFYYILENMFDRAKKENSTFSLVLADVDYFKTYNDALGHLEGDKVLKQIGEIIGQEVPAGAVAARYGGEEFSILLPGYSSQQARDVAEQIRRKVENYSFVGKEYQPDKKITLSMGIATYPAHARTPLELIRRADDALFRAKSVRKNRTEIYFSVLDELCTDQISTSEDLASTLKTLLSVIQAKDRYTRGHSERVTEYAVVLGEYLNLPEEELNTLRMSAFLHDIGKIELERELLNKPLPLNEEERLLFQQHPVWGAEIVRSVSLLERCTPIILAHHENFDGSGYPYGLKGEEIPLGARILRVVDSFDAMATNRPYRRALKPGRCLEELRQGAGTLYDPEIVVAFFNVAERIFRLLAS
ncbi:bifunctional diguanylate cyclase/phosphohydrolase [Moorella sulfitireducens]|uniref:bifunctional diguanylate cyclase/phosphohydrolase n=1 Tax=Neomoorella sulfitireducens TaxID=2972948 RepID=UPI0021AC43F5|nr:diguanylate cyclase [Moorella sulfitireducens]